jgi:hypothetical protein
MPIVRLALAGLLGLTAPIVAHVVPLAGKSGPAVSSPAPGRLAIGTGYTAEAEGAHCSGSGPENNPQ